jgi:hypothetical protein
MTKRPERAIALPTPADPTVVAIARHRAACKAALVAADVCGAIENAQAGHHARAAASAAARTADREERDALRDLLASAPTTVAGVRALLEYERDTVRGYSEPFVARLETRMTATVLRSPVLALAA